MNIVKSKIDGTKFGSITINSIKYDNDIIIRPDNTIEKRKKKLSKEEYGTSHIVSKKEAKYIYGDGAKYVIIGSGQYGALKLSDEASDFFKSVGCIVICKATPEAVKEWNETGIPKAGMFHITC